MKKMPLIRFRIDFAEDSNLGPGKIALLEGIRKHGSVSEAARRMDMSYRRAWLLIEDMKVNLDEPVVESNAGGIRGGGASVTAFGKQLIASYRRLERDFQELTEVQFADLATHAKVDAGWPLVSAVSTKRKLKSKEVE